MKEELSLTTERLDDFVVLLAIMRQMDLPGILDRQIPRHWLQQGLSWGWTATIWLAHIVSQGDHRKLPVRDWVRQAHHTLEQVTGLKIRETDFTDDRLTIVLRYLSDATRWQAIEQELGQNLIRVYELEEQVIRVDATTVSGYRVGGEGSLWQFGHSKDDPTLRQIKVMMATLDPLGLPLALEVVSGEQADDPLYVPTIDRVLACLDRQGLLIVGDCKMSALATRAHLEAHKQYYLTPLALVGETAELLPAWIEAGVAQGESLTEVLGEDGKQVLARGYELSRMGVNGELNWQERVRVVRSQAYATNAPPKRLSLADAVREYRHEYHIEQSFGRFKGAPLSLAPMFVKRDDQVVGLTHLLSIALRVLTLMEFVVRRALKQQGATLVG